MTTTLSPARRAGLTPRFTGSKECWSKRDLMRVWTPVRLKIDPRHEGEIFARFGNTYTVRWPKNGWFSDHKQDELEKVG